MFSDSPQMFRASRHLVVFWDEGRLFGHNYLTKVSLSLTTNGVCLLAALDTWSTAEDLAARVPALGTEASPILDVLTQATLIDRRSTHAVENDDPIASWGSWKPLAAVLHFSTRNGVFPSDPEWTAPPGTLDRSPMPEPCKHYDEASRTVLPQEGQFGTLTDALNARRTWRTFGNGSLSLFQLATLLRLTFGVRHWRPREFGQVAFKTSPSGGARHPVEAYVAAGKVDGLAAGLYHFDAASHDLTLVKPGVTRADLVRYSAGQDYFGDAAVMVFMTAMFGRTMWRYASPRAYRTVHIELGHLGQTFCLLATALGLAPFTTMALSEAAIERDLSLDGVNESAMYIVGAGRLP